MAARPAEHRALFKGNNDDHFRLGVKITQGALRLFTDPYQSDIIIASPIAMVRTHARTLPCTHICMHAHACTHTPRVARRCRGDEPPAAATACGGPFFRPP